MPMCDDMTAMYQLPLHPVVSTFLRLFLAE